MDGRIGVRSANNEDSDHMIIVIIWWLTYRWKCMVCLWALPPDRCPLYFPTVLTSKRCSLDKCDCIYSRDQLCPSLDSRRSRSWRDTTRALNTSRHYCSIRGPTSCPQPLACAQLIWSLERSEPKAMDWSWRSTRSLVTDGQSRVVQQQDSTLFSAFLVIYWFG